MATAQQERDWLHVGDHCRAVDLLIDRGTSGEVYNVGGGNHVVNADLTRQILDLTGRPHTLIRPVADRPGHDRRYSLDTSKLQGLGWTPQVPFERWPARDRRRGTSRTSGGGGRSRTPIRTSALITTPSTAPRPS